MAIDFSATASLMLPNEPSGDLAPHGAGRWQGPLRDMIERAMTMPDADRQRAVITVGPEAGTAKTVLRFQDFQALAAS